MAEALQPMMSAPAYDHRSVVRLFPPLTLLLFAGPVVVGLAGTVLPAFGYGSGHHGYSLASWRMLIADPSVPRALVRSIGSGFAATAIALAITFAILAQWQSTSADRRIQKILAPLLAMPHAAFAIGLAFLIAPSGWLIRLIGFTRPPDVALIQDPWCIALTLALVCKETPFLLLMCAAALHQIPAARYTVLARTLGYARATAWLLTVAPLVYRQIRLPVFAVLVYGLSVVDMAIVLGPTSPPPLAVLLLDWFRTSDQRAKAAAGALLLAATVAVSIAAWCMLEAVLARVTVWAYATGARRRAARTLSILAPAAAGGIGLLSALSILLVLIWSVAAVWPFPNLVPERLSLTAWTDHQVGSALVEAMFIGATATMIGLCMAIGCLENELYRDARRALSLIYAPLLVPQVAFLFGLQIVLVVLDRDGTFAAVVAAHLVFVVPYIFLTLGDPYRGLDPRYSRVAATLGAGAWRVFWRIRLRLLARPVAISAAVGFAVSIGQYLATLLPGAGRIETVTTAAVALSSGGDRRLTAAFAAAQMLLPFLAFAAALLLSPRPKT